MMFYIKENNPGLYRFILGIFFITVMSAFFVFLRVQYRGNLRYAFLVWNIFLAWVPFYFSLLLTQGNIKRRVLRYITAFFWLMFYPNAPYIVTDFIHLSAYNFYRSESFAFNANFGIWYDFFLISIFVVNGLVISYASLKLIHGFVIRRIGRALGWLFVAVVSILSGYAIYLGRFIRVNSWEIITNPLNLLRVLVINLTPGGIAFTLLFSFMVFIIYLSFYMLGGFQDQK